MWQPEEGIDNQILGVKGLKESFEKLGHHLAILLLFRARESARERDANVVWSRLPRLSGLKSLQGFHSAQVTSGVPPPIKSLTANC